MVNHTHSRLRHRFAGQLAKATALLRRQVRFVPMIHVVKQKTFCFRAYPISGDIRDASLLGLPHCMKMCSMQLLIITEQNIAKLIWI